MMDSRNTGIMRLKGEKELIIIFVFDNQYSNIPSIHYSDWYSR